MRAATLLLLLNIPKGISGYLASLFLLNMKNRDMAEPKTIRQMTMGEFQGKVAPPKSRPSRIIISRPSIEALPNQSTAFMPSVSFVLGLCTSKNSNSKRKAIPAIGKLIQKHHRHERSSVKAPPSTGPIPPAMAHKTSDNPKKRARRLHGQKVSGKL